MTRTTCRSLVFLVALVLIPAFALEAFARGGGGGGRGGGPRAGAGGARGGTGTGRTGTSGRVNGRTNTSRGRAGTSASGHDFEALREAEERRTLIQERRDRLMDLDRRREQEALLAGERMHVATHPLVD